VPRGKLTLRSEWRRKVRDAIYEVAEELIREGVHQFTVRQLFYQLVSKGVFESTKNNYKNFDALLVRLREEDSWLDSLFIDTSKPRLEYYDSRYWKGQKYFVEIWLEKDALRAFFQPYCNRYNVNLIICRGYPSVTRLREAKEARHVPPEVQYVILYFGDFDPSGEDIFRWINEELEPYNIKVVKVALTRRQVRKYKLPPMIPKRTDPRTRKFVQKYGEVAVELDALHPKILRDLIRRSILKYMDVEKRMQVEVSEGIVYEAYLVVDEVLSEIRRKLTEKAQEAIRGEVNKVLPLVYTQLVEAVRRAERLDLSELYDRRAVIESLKAALREIL